MGRSGTGRVNIEEVRDGSSENWKGLGWVRGPSGRSRTGRGTLR